MEKFDRFYFEGFEFDRLTLKAKFFYSFDKKVDFEEEIDFSCDFLNIRKDFDENIFENMLFSLSLAVGVSYYKAYPTKELIVESGFLSDDDKLFWQKFYRNGLGEFLYTNNLNPEGLFNFVSNSEKIYKKIDFQTSEKSLLPLGGGKDSIVSAEILRKNSLEFTPIIFGKSDQIKENCLKVMGEKAILIKRYMSQTLFNMLDNGYYNGHVPITGIISFVLFATAYLYDYKYIILSNEKSANTGNTNIGDLEVNHQYSKSLEFEQDLANYVTKNLTSTIKYFSLLRGMYEIKIAEIFSKIGKKYFGFFSSCNNNFRIKKKVSIKSGIWCNSCPKCAFVYSILRPFITDKENLAIFGKELYEDKNLEQIFRELLGISGIKPFECVGEEEEMIYAMDLHLKNLKNKMENIPFILQIFEKEVKNKYDNANFEDIKEKLFKIYNDETLIPEKFSKIITNN
nr:hypothetical protein [Candidatus Gracilibacteria bacterium]